MIPSRTGTSSGTSPTAADGGTAGSADQRRSADLSLALPPRYSVDDILLANETVQHGFTDGLHAIGSTSARAHLAHDRRLPAWLVAEEGFGYIPPGTTVVRTLARQQRIPFELCVEAGLLRRAVRPAQTAFITQHGRPPTSSVELSAFFADQLVEQEAFYSDYPPLKTLDGTWVHGDWLTIPIRVRDPTNALRIAGFQYRSLRLAAEIGKHGRYRSPPNTCALRWEETLLGLAEERDTIAASGEVILVEGKFDQVAIRAAMASLPVAQRPGAVALGGLRTRGATGRGETPDARAGVLALLSQVGARRIVIFLDDEDEATMAALRIATLLAPLGVEVHIATVRDAWSARGRRPPPEAAEIPKDPSMLWACTDAEAIQTVVLRARARDFLETIALVIERQLRDSPHSGQTYQRLTAMDTALDCVRFLPPADHGRIIPLIANAVHLSPQVVQLAMQRRLHVADHTVGIEPHQPTVEQASSPASSALPATLSTLSWSPRHL